MKNKIEFLPPLKVNAIDTSGAGDTFDGAFLSRLAQDIRHLMQENML